MPKPESPRVVREMPSAELGREEFRRRFFAGFYDPAFDAVRPQLEQAAEVAWRSYAEYHKSPRTRPAGPEFHDPSFELPIEWLEARERIREAERAWRDPASPSRILLVNGSSRSEHTCPGESSKTYRLAALAREAIEAEGGFEVDLLDLSRLASEYGRRILPCKACVSTAMPLCHWPCSCYPNHALGQTGDWMNEIYPRWMRAHGVMIVSPVNWYQAPSVLKLMIDRLVCADGGNPDPTTTRGKTPALAKQVELAGWRYPRHLAGRAFAVVVHGDAAGVEALTRNLCDWLTDMELIQAGASGGLGRYLGYYQPYATSHDDLDRDAAFQAETRLAARALAVAVRGLREGRYQPPDADLEPVRPK